MSGEKPTISRRGFVAVSVATAALVGSTQEAAAAVGGTCTVPEYIVRRLHGLGVQHFFGVPGATCDPLFEAAQHSPMKVVISSSDLGAGYAADGYARTAGLAAISLTYGVGTRTILPVISGAFVERSPIVLFNGGPSTQDLRLQNELDTLFSHSDGMDDGDLQAFAPMTAFSVRIEQASDVPRMVDAAIRAALDAQRPVYVEVAKHLWWARCAAPSPELPMASPPPTSGDAAALADTIVTALRGAQRPVVLVGVEVRRFGLQDQVTDVIRQLGCPWVSTMLGKGVLDESLVGFSGVYAGRRSVPDVRTLVEGSDGVLAIGCVFGRQYRTLLSQNRDALFRIHADRVKVGRGDQVQASGVAVLRELQSASLPDQSNWRDAVALTALDFDTRRQSIVQQSVPTHAETGVGYEAVLRSVSARLTEAHLVITDTSLSMYPAGELHIRGRDGLLCNAVWAAIGYSVGAAVGAALGQQRRPIVLCGDGGFQMTCAALSVMARHQLPCVVLVLDNGMYGIEQWLLDPSWYRQSGDQQPRPHMLLQPWDYAALAQSMGIAHAVSVAETPALEQALDDALDRDGPSVIAVRIPPHDLPMELRA